MKILDADTMRKEEEYTISNYIPSLLLMENAALEVVGSIEQSYLKDKNILVFCGPGNNGGDGFAVARHLYIKYTSKVNICFLGQEKKMSKDASLNYKICRDLNIEFRSFEKLKESINEFDLIVDALFGIGLTRNIEGVYKEAIDLINKTDAYKVAVDIASGISANTGQIYNVAVEADMTVTFHSYKLGHILYPGRAYAGEINVKDIGIVKKYIKNTKYNLINYNEVYLKKRKKEIHKGNTGKILIVAGSLGFSGAAYMAATGALNVGAGLVSLAIPKSINEIMEIKTTEIMTLPLEDRETGIILEENYSEIEKFVLKNKIDTLLIGPGMRRDKRTIACIQKIIKNIDIPMVLDADALFAIKDNLEIIRDKNIILTPHHGEFLRLIKKDKLENKLEEAEKFAEKYNINLVLKGADTIITNGKNTYINFYGNPGMAVGGMGDILAGIITVLVDEDISKSVAEAVFFHSYTADQIIKEKAMQSLLPGDILDNIGKVMLKFEYNK